MGRLLSPKSGGKDYKQPGCNTNTLRAATERRHVITLVMHCDCVGQGRRRFAWHVTEPPSKGTAARRACDSGPQEARRSYFSPSPQPQLIIGKSGILRKTERTPHTPAGMNRCSHFRQRFGSSSKGDTHSYYMAQQFRFSTHTRSHRSLHSRARGSIITSQTSIN